MFRSYVPVFDRCVRLIEAPYTVHEFFCNNFEEVESLGRSMAPMFSETNTASFRHENIARLGVCGDKDSWKTRMTAALLNIAPIKIHFRSIMHNQLLAMSQEFGNVCRVDKSGEYEGPVGPYGGRDKEPGEVDFPINPEKPEFHIVEHPDFSKLPDHLRDHPDYAPKVKTRYDVVAGLDKGEGQFSETRKGYVLVSKDVATTHGYTQFLSRSAAMRRDRK